MRLVVDGQFLGEAPYERGIPDPRYPISDPDPRSPIPGKDQERPNNLNLVLGFYPPAEEEQTGETSDLNVFSMSLPLERMR